MIEILFLFAGLFVGVCAGALVALVVERIRISRQRKKANLAPMLGVVFPKEKK